jgi:acetoin utilization protein AcuB
MNPTPNTVTPDVELADAAKLIHDRKLNGITVVDAQGELVGILTTTNALEALIYFAEEARRAK